MQSEVRFSQVVPPPTRNPVSTHLVSNVSLGSFACSFITPRNIACAFFQGLFAGSNSRVALTCTSLNGSGLLARDVTQHFVSRVMGVTPFKNPKKTIMFVSDPAWDHGRSIPSRKRPNYPALCDNESDQQVLWRPPASCQCLECFSSYTNIFRPIRETTKVFCSNLDVDPDTVLAALPWCLFFIQTTSSAILALI